ncbi:MAG: YhjD/YihY/BrkB family envelope integrity protein [Halothiobacillaceae bacterium]
MQSFKARLQSLHDMIWQDAPKAGPLAGQLRRFARMMLWAGSELGSGMLQLHAMSLAYVTLLSLVPLLAVTFSVLKAFGAHNMIEPTLATLLEPLGEKGPEVTMMVTGFVDSISVGVLGAVGVAVLFYTVFNLIRKIERVFNLIWHVEENRPTPVRFASYISVILVGPVLLLAAGALTTSLLTTPLIQNLREIALFGQVIAWLTSLAPVLIITVALGFIYVLIPNTRVKPAAAVVGALVAGLLWHLVGWGFAALVSGSANYSAIYSAFASLVLFMIWLQIAWMIVLLGNLVTYAWQNLDALAPGGHLVDLTGAEREALAIELMAAICHDFDSGQPPPNENRLARRVGLGVRLIRSGLDNLHRYRLIHAVEAPHAGWVPARPCARVTLADIVRAVREDDRPLRLRADSPAARCWRTRQERFSKESLGTVTIRADDGQTANLPDQPPSRETTGTDAGESPSGTSAG